MTDQQPAAPQNPAAPIKVRIEVRRLMALELRKQGASYRQIAMQLRKQEGISPKYSEGAAYKDVMDALRRLNRQVDNTAAELRALELERLEELWKKFYQMALTGDTYAFNACMGIIDRRDKYLGISKPVPRENLNIDVTQLSTEQLERIANGEDPVIVLATSGNSGAGTPPPSGS